MRVYFNVTDVQISVSPSQIHRDIYDQYNAVCIFMLLVRIGPPCLVVVAEMRSKSYRFNYGRRSTATGLCHGDRPSFARDTRPLYFRNFWRGAQVLVSINIINAIMKKYK